MSESVREEQKILTAQLKIVRRHSTGRCTQLHSLSDGGRTISLLNSMVEYLTDFNIFPPIVSVFKIISWNSKNYVVIKKVRIPSQDQSSLSSTTIFLEFLKTFMSCFCNDVQLPFRRRRAGGLCRPAVCSASRVNTLLWASMVSRSDALEHIDMWRSSE